MPSYPVLLKMKIYSIFETLWFIRDENQSTSLSIRNEIFVHLIRSGHVIYQAVGLVQYQLNSSGICDEQYGTLDCFPTMSFFNSEMFHGKI
jgi:hypothetical protein